MRKFIKHTLFLMLSLLFAINLYFAVKENIYNIYFFSTKNSQEAQTNNSDILSTKYTDIIDLERQSGRNTYVPVPNIIIQYGVGGTATTLQFQILCVLMAILHESEINSLGCFYGRKPLHKYTVIKTHDVTDNWLRSLPKDSWIFMTSSSLLSAEKQLKFENTKRKTQNMKLKCPYTADIENVAKRGHFIVYEYQTVFGVSDDQINKAVDYLRYWDILRLCCGKQMSADWRNHLSPRKRYILRHDPHSSTYPACEMYNISEVENLLMKTYVFQRYSHIPSLHDVIGKPSNVDGDINGHYCERCNRNISMNQLHFNEECV